MLTISVSLFVWGAFLLVESNLEAAMERWRGEARLIVYLEPNASTALERQLKAGLTDVEWVESVNSITSSEAGRRFVEAFPSLSEVMDGWEESPLPPSLEVTLRRDATDDRELQAWLDELAVQPGVESLDDDRDWLGRLESLATTGRTVGLVVGLVLLGAATLTTASVIRLAALTYKDEVSVMRIVGATEFLIRGPFYGEGLLQGGLGALVAAGTLYGGYHALATRTDGLLGELLFGRFLTPAQLLFLLGVGCLAGLVGATISLRGEILGKAPR